MVGALSLVGDKALFRGAGEEGGWEDGKRKPGLDRLGCVGTVLHTLAGAYSICTSAFVFVLRI